MKASGALHGSHRVSFPSGPAKSAAGWGPGCLVEKTRPSLSQHIASVSSTMQFYRDPWMVEAARALQP